MKTETTRPIQPAQLGKHSPQVMKCDMRSADFHTKSWSYRFNCPTCGKSQRANTNFLGKRHMVCNGDKIAKISPTTHTIVYCVK